MSSPNPAHQLTLIFNALPCDSEYELWPMTDANIPSISTAMDTLTDMHVKAILCEMNLVKVNSSNEIVITSHDKMMDIQMHLETASYKVLVRDSRYRNNTHKSFYICKQNLPTAANQQAQKRRRHVQSLVFDLSY